MKKYFVLLLFITTFSFSQVRVMEIDDLFKAKRISDPQISPDGKWITFVVGVVNKDENKTNNDIWIMNSNSEDLKQLTNDPKSDNHPRWSADSKTISFTSTRKGAPQIFTMDTKGENLKQITNISTGASQQTENKNITKNWDYVVTGFEWSSDSKYIFTPSEEKAEELLWRISADGKEIKKITLNGVTNSFSVSNSGVIVFTKASLNRPAEIYKIVNGGDEVKLTGFNDQLFSEINFSLPEKIWYDGARVKNQLWLIRPPNFNPTKKYPLVYLIHGGPQGAWLNGWSNRWNPQLWAAQGYVVVAPNPTGSTGFGQKFTNDISGDWGGAVYVDLMKGLDFVTKKYTFIDTTKMAAAGASYGGYMMNWFQGHTKRFKTLITHCGVYNFFSMYGTTEEVWFDDWEHGGSPWEKKDEYNKFSPHSFAENFSTPNLIIHNELDFRVPFSEGMQLFTVLQKKELNQSLFTSQMKGIGF